MLADAGVRAAKSKERGYKLNDSGGLVLFITKSGGKLWRLRYTYRGKEKLLSFGPDPKVSLLNARDQRDAAKAVLREGTRLFKTHSQGGRCGRCAHLRSHCPRLARSKPCHLERAAWQGRAR